MFLNIFWREYASFQSVFTKPTLSTDVVTIEDLDDVGNKVFIDLPWGFTYTTSNGNFFNNPQTRFPAGVTFSDLTFNGNSGSWKVMLASDYTRWITVILSFEPRPVFYNALYNYEFIMPGVRDTKGKFINQVQVARTFSNPLARLYQINCPVGYKNSSDTDFTYFRRFILPPGGNLILANNVSIYDAFTNQEHLGINGMAIVDLTMYNSGFVSSHDIARPDDLNSWSAGWQFAPSLDSKYLVPKVKRFTNQLYGAVPQNDIVFTNSEGAVRKGFIPRTRELVTSFYDLKDGKIMYDILPRWNILKSPTYILPSDGIWKQSAPPPYIPPEQTQFLIPSLIERDLKDYSL